VAGSTISFLHTQIHEFSLARLQLADVSSQTDEKTGKWLYMAIQTKQRAVDMEGSEESEELPENVLARQFAHLFMDFETLQDANRRKYMLTEFDSFLSDIQATSSIDQFDRTLRERTLLWAQSNYFVGGRLENLKAKGGENVDMFWREFPDFFKKVPYFKQGRVYASYASVEMDRDDDATPLVLEELVEAASSLVQAKRSFVVGYEMTTMPMFEYMALFDVLTSPATYSGNLSEPGKLSSVINKIARIDRLPPDNSLAGLSALQFAWDAADVCHHVSSQMKVFAKVSYVVLLFMGILIGTLSIYALNQPEQLDKDDLNTATSYLSLLSGILTGFVTIIAPAAKWTRLRGAALAIEVRFCVYYIP